MRRSTVMGPGARMVLAVLLGAGCGSGGDTAPAGGGGGPASRTRKVPVRVAAVEEREVTYTIDAVGSVLANETVRVPARVAGVLQDIAFAEGTPVKPGMVLARIDPERYRLNRERLEASLRQAEAQLKVNRAALEKREQLRARDPGWVTREELDNHAARVEESAAAMAAARAALALASKDEEESAVKVEKPGIIDRKLADTGQYVAAGTPIASLVDTSKLKLSFTLGESESVRLGREPDIRFRVKGLPEKEFRARLYHVGQQASEATRAVECLAWVEEPGPELRPGFFADVTIQVGRDERSLVVPETTVLPTERGFIAWVIKGEDEVEARSLRLGLHTRDGHVEVLEGLRAGDRVVVRGGASLNPASRVQLEPEPESGS